MKTFLEFLREQQELNNNHFKKVSIKQALLSGYISEKDLLAAIENYKVEK